ncbi:hypothetical protein HGRIS_007830 [Hohenbuehelia grisea]|uniref:Peroxisomal membrane protein PEX14 n=1 Tax=Hohenbuehelia grisea TaxID=104357 RepID=A0ABR3J6G2_9AGAR
MTIGEFGLGFGLSSQVTMSARDDLIRNAVAFLVDSKSQASPLAQRIQFLEAKGLTPAEIDIAVKQASLNQTVAQPSPSLPVYGPSPYPLVPPRQQWDWRDYFITAVVSGTVAYGAAALFRVCVSRSIGSTALTFLLFQKYLLPHLQPPSSTAYEGDRDALTAQFDAAETLLKEIQAEASAVRVAVEKQKEEIDKTTKEVNSIVTDMRESEVKTRDEMREIRDEVNNIREMLPKMIEKNKESQTQSLAELQQELKSLKTLLLSRGPSISTPTTPLPTFGKPSIPAWQLAGSASATPSSAPTVEPTGSPSSSWVLSSSTSSEKGKDRESNAP